MAEPSHLKVELSADLDRARARIARNFTALCGDLDVPRHLKSSFTRNKGAFIGGATVLGFLISKLPSRKKKVFIDRKSKERVKEVEKAGLGLLALKLAMNAAKPALVSFATKKIAEIARARPGGESR